MAAEEGALPVNVGDEESRNAVKHSLTSKGDTSYYYAHGREREDLSKATQIAGDGKRQLADPVGGPSRLDKEDAWLQTERERSTLLERVRWREDYAWGDDGAKVKLYIDFPEGSLKHADCKVESKFDQKSFELLVHGAGGGDAVEGVRNGEHELSNSIVPEKCSHRVNAAKSKITVTLVKEDENEAWSTLKKKVISKHTGWN
mmetsp:Transcript_60763/g.161425  ORF Transcript_60763/g.161425 Transcript_60763/m.161425 type:complete len:202 (-) Transcript_60763:174-779(-)